MEPPVIEVREMVPDIYAKLLTNLTGQQLYDILFQNALMTSGSKEEKVKRILECHLSERSVFNHLRKEDLAILCRKFGLQLSGSKQELVDRLLDYYPSDSSELQPVNEVSIEKIVTKDEHSSKTELLVNDSPNLLDDVNLKFPELDHSEKIIIAILKEAKSLTEQDIERIM